MNGDDFFMIQDYFTNPENGLLKARSLSFTKQPWMNKDKLSGLSIPVDSKSSKTVKRLIDYSIFATATPITFPPLSIIGPPLLPLFRAASV